MLLLTPQKPTIRKVARPACRNNSTPQGAVTVHLGHTSQPTPAEGWMLKIPPHPRCQERLSDTASHRSASALPTPQNGVLSHNTKRHHAEPFSPCSQQITPLSSLSGRPNPPQEQSK